MTTCSFRACFTIIVENKVHNIPDPKQSTLPPERTESCLMQWSARSASFSSPGPAHFHHYTLSQNLILNWQVKVTTISATCFKFSKLLFFFLIYCLFVLHIPRKKACCAALLPCGCLISVWQMQKSWRYPFWNSSGEHRTDSVPRPCKPNNLD